jgi:hypothetical protein
MCGRLALLPQSLEVLPLYGRGVLTYRGGFGDVFKDHYQGREVAVKVLRVYETSDFKKIRKVCCL